MVRENQKEGQIVHLKTMSQIRVWMEPEWLRKCPGRIKPLPHGWVLPDSYSGPGKMTHLSERRLYAGEGFLWGLSCSLGVSYV